MTQTVISAPPRTGKSLKSVELIDQYSKKEPHRRIYTNIVGMNYPGVILIQSTLQKPFDWRDLPNGSILFYDEAHEHPAFCSDDLLTTYEIDDGDYIKEIATINIRNDLKVKEREELLRIAKERQKRKLEKAKEDIRDIGRSLTLHGHFGIDIFLITQKPNLLNKYVKAATSEHLVLRRLFKMPACTIYSFAEVQDSFGFQTRKNALSWKFWWYPKQLYKYYISSEEHNAKAKLPFTLVFPVILFFAIILGALYKTSHSPIFQRWLGNKEQNSNIVTETAQKTSSSTTTGTDTTKQTSTFNADSECRKGENVEKPECVQWFNDLSKNKSSVSQDGVMTVSYNPNKPYEFKPDVQIQVRDFPRLSGCARDLSGKYKGIDQQGNLMPSISQADCKRWLNGERLFDYTKAPQQVQNNAQFNNQSNTSNDIQQTSKQYIPQEVEVANNYVEPHLQAKVTNGANDQAGFNNAF